MSENGKEVSNENSNGSLKVRWKNRRKMAWTALTAMILLTFTIMFTEAVSIEKLKVLSEVITWFYFSCASVVGAYMGFTTYASVKGK